MNTVLKKVYVNKYTKKMVTQIPLTEIWDYREATEYECKKFDNGLEFSDEIQEWKRLTCGCCGQDFKTWKWYIDQDQDAWYWICFSCQCWNEQHEIWKLIYDALSDENKAKADKYTQEQRDVIVFDALDKWLVKYTIWR